MKQEQELRFLFRKKSREESHAKKEKKREVG